MGQRKGPSGANAPPVHGIKKCFVFLSPKCFTQVHLVATQESCQLLFLTKTFCTSVFSEPNLSFCRYWIYDKNFRKIKGPARLSNFIKNSKATGLDRIDAAMVWDGNSRVYFFRRDKYWRYNEERKEIDPGYPKKISVWRGVQSPVDGAFSWKNSRSFFLRANNIDKFNNYKFAVQKGRGLKKFIRNC